MRLRQIISVGICLSAMAFAQDSNRKKKVDGGPNFYSIEKELALGRQLAIEVEKQAKLFDDPIVTEYVSRLCQTLARHSDVVFPVSIKMIDSDQPNAFTLPGGHLFINTGLVRLSESESELAATIAHELAHVAARHATRQATASKLADYATIPLIFVGGPLDALARNVALPMSFLKFSRVFETEADLLGLHYLYDAGYDPAASLDIFERLEAAERKKPGSVGQLFLDHPVTADRILKSQKTIQNTLPPRAEYVVNTSDYEEVRERLVGILEARRVVPPLERKPTLLRATEH